MKKISGLNLEVLQQSGHCAEKKILATLPVNPIFAY
jgi:hypothetical protein